MLFLAAFSERFGVDGFDDATQCAGFTIFFVVESDCHNNCGYRQADHDFQDSDLVHMLSGYPDFVVVKHSAIRIANQIKTPITCASTSGVNELVRSFLAVRRPHGPKGRLATPKLAPAPADFVVNLIQTIGDQAG
jgi:hypothetical protein